MAAGDDSSVNLASPTGTTDTRLNSAGEHRQVVILGNPGDLVAGVTGYGALRVTLEPTNLFSDPFDVNSGLDTTNRWTTGGTVAPTSVTGAVSVLPGATTGASSSLVSQATFPPPGLEFLGLGTIARFENIGASAGAVGYLNSHRFWGFGSIPATWTATYSASSTSGPLLSGVGFEIDVDGNMYCVVYDNGVRTRPQGATVNSVRAVFDGNAHQFLIVMRADAIFWYVDGTTNPIASYTYATTGFSSPDTSSLPIRFHTINSGTAPSGTMVHRQGAVGVGDTGRNNIGLSDGTYPWRKARVSKLGSLAMGGTPVTPTSGAIAAGATGTIGPVDVSEAGNVSFILKNTVAASPWAGAPVVIFEQSDDAVSWSALMVSRSDTNSANYAFVLGANTASNELIFEAPLEGVNWVRARVTTGPTTNGMTLVIQPGTLPFMPIVTTADRKDGAARTTVNLYATSVTAGTSGTAALVTMTISKGQAATTTGTTYALGAGKTLRITGIRFQHVAGAATANSVIWALRLNPAGAVTTTSTPVLVQAVTRGPATANAVSTYDIPIGEGMEITNPTGGTVNIGLTVTPTWTTTALTYDVHIVGYEY